MRVLAIRVREVGCFSAPMALEGLSGGLDVLAGPNEAGKSTLFRALRTALLWKHTAGGEAIDSLKPYGGGSPMIEVDLDIDGARYRLRKQFGAGRSAALSDLARGRIVARGADADAEIARLIGAVGASGRTIDAGRHGLLWVEQGKSLVQPAVGETLSAALSRLIAAEAAAVADGELARAVLARAEARLAADITAARGAARANSGYARACEEREAWRRKAEAAAARVTETAATRERLVEARRVLVEQYGIEPRGRAVEAEARAREAVEAAHKAASRLEAAEKDVALARERLTAAQGARLAFEERVRRLAECEAALVTARAEREAASTALAGAEAKAAAAATAFERAQAVFDRVSARALALARAGQRAQVRERIGEIEAALARHCELAREIEPVGAELAGIGIDAAALSAMERAAASASELATRIEAASASVEIDYVDAPRVPVRIGGSAIAGGKKILVDGTLTLDIEGVGRIVIMAGSGVDLVRLGTQKAAADGELAGLLAGAGVATLEAARMRLHRRRELTAARDRLQAEMRAIAPAGADALAAEIGRLRAGLADMEDAGAGDIATEAGATEAGAADASTGLIERARGERDLAARERDAAARLLAQARSRCAAAAGAIERYEAAIADLATALPVAEARVVAMDSLVMAEARACQAVEEATRSRDAWAAAVPQPSAMRALEADLSGLVAARQRLEADRVRLEKQIALDEAALERDGEQDVETVHAEAVDALASAAERVAALEREHEALRLVIALLKEESGARRSGYMAPVLARLVPMLSQLLPGAGVALGDGLSVTGLVRSGAVEAVERLSDGTREQIAVLVRLAFARVLVDAGSPAPLVLDDALVFSDDARLERMFALIGEASRVSQVIVLSCQEARVGALARAQGGRVLRLVAWQADAAAA